MAIDKELWNKAKAYFEAGKSLNFIQDKTGINRTSIGKKANKEGWEKDKILHLNTDIQAIELENSTLNEKKSTLVEKLSSLDKYQIEILQDLTEDELKSKSIIFSGLNLGAIRIHQNLQRNTKQIVMKVKEGFGGGASTETIELVDVELDNSDINNGVDALTKIGKAQGIIETSSQVQVNNSNNQQTNVTLEIE